MENFFNYISKPITEDEFTLWFESNNIIFEKLEVYQDFVVSLVLMIMDTYLGDDGDENAETKIRLTKDEKDDHFEWCWNKVVNNFSKENIMIEQDGEHKVFLKDFIFEIYYEQKKYHLAIETYRKLKQVQPDKGSYFNALIKEIEREMNEGKA
jgi:hypothetical protein